MQRMLNETNRRRAIQEEYNTKHGIEPKTVEKSIEQVMRGTMVADEKMGEGHETAYGRSSPVPLVADPVIKYLTDDQKRDLVEQLRTEMKEASDALEFEKAAELRDAIKELEDSIG
jgi:excinuclease ABC subunit B